MMRRRFRMFSIERRVLWQSLKIAAAILDRCELMPPEVWGRLHGAIRSLRPAPSPPAGP